MDEIKNKDCMRLLDEIVALYEPINERETEYPDGFIKAMFVARYNELIQRHCLNQAIFEKLTDLDGGMDDGDLPKFQKAVAELKLLLLKKGKNNITALEVSDSDVLKASGIFGAGYGLRGAAGRGVKGLAKGGVVGGAAGLGLGYGANMLRKKIARNLETRRLRKEYEKANNIYASAFPTSLIKNSGSKIASKVGAPKRKAIDVIKDLKNPGNNTYRQGALRQEYKTITGKDYPRSTPKRGAGFFNTNTGKLNRAIASDYNNYRKEIDNNKAAATIFGTGTTGLVGAGVGYLASKKIPILKGHTRLSSLAGGALGAGAYELLLKNKVNDRIEKLHSAVPKRIQNRINNPYNRQDLRDALREKNNYIDKHMETIASEQRTPYIRDAMRQRQNERVTDTTLGGGLLGAGVGYLAGRKFGRGGVGALVGGLAAGYGGSRLGKAVNREENRKTSRYSNSEMRDYLQQQEMRGARQNAAYGNMLLAFK